ncbi:hypothetical protein PM082_015077 [Marasmius tenuissimus]|nr:hypothetical protein PM082_015077 [Marasmius tenuissimus]
MSFGGSRPPVTPQQRRIQIIMTTIPLIVVSSYILYKRLVLGEPQRRFHKPEDDVANATTQRFTNQSTDAGSGGSRE